VISGILFVLYPAIRPFSDETSLQGAAAFASTEWLVAHILAMIAFTLLPLGLLGFYNSLQEGAVKSLAYWSVIMCWIGIGLTLPFYGGEAYGLHALGQEAIKQQNPALISLAADVRSGAGLVMFLIGLLLLAIAAVILAIAILSPAGTRNGAASPSLLECGCIFRNSSVGNRSEWHMGCLSPLVVYG
jgi:hypothetical protein